MREQSKWDKMGVKPIKQLSLFVEIEMGSMGSKKPVLLSKDVRVYDLIYLTVQLSFFNTKLDGTEGFMISRKLCQI